MAVSYKPPKNASASTVRAPFLPSMRILASSATAQAGSSAAGSANAMEPPKVPRLRTAGCATWGMALAISGAWVAISAEDSTSTWRVIAPI